MTYNSLLGYGSHSKDSRLKAHCPLQETSGTAAAERETAVDATITGHTPTASAGPGGYLPNALVGINTWGNKVFFASTFAVTNRTYIGHLYRTNNANTYLVSGTSTAGGLRAALNNHRLAILTPTTETTNNFVPLSVWNALACRYDGTDVHFNNGATKESVANTRGSQTIQGFANFSHTGGFPLATDDKMADWAVFDDALSDAEVAEYFAGPEPVNTVAPVESGTETEGSLLTCTTGTWGLPSGISGTNGTITYAYQWTRSNDGSGTGEADIGSAEFDTYTLVSGDVGKYIRCRVRASNTGDYDSAADTNSNFSGVIAGAGVNATLTATLDGVTASSAVVSPINAAITVTLDGVTTASAVVSPITAGVTAQLDGVTATSTAVSAINATLTAQLDGVTASSAVVSPITAGVTAQLDGVTATSTAVSAISSTVTAQLDGVTASSAAISPINTTLTATLDGVTATSTASSTISAGVTAQLDGVTATSTATSPIDAALTATLDGVSVAATATADAGVSATVTVTLDGVMATSSAESTISAGVTATLGGVTAISSVTSPITAGVTATLDGVTVSAAATGPTGNAATLTAQLDGVTAASAVVSSIAGSLTAHLVGVTAVSAATSLITAGVTSTLDGVTVSSRIGDPDQSSGSSLYYRMLL